MEDTNCIDDRSDSRQSVTEGSTGQTSVALLDRDGTGGAPTAHTDHRYGLILSSESANIQEVTALLQAGAEVNTTDENGDTALMKAVASSSYSESRLAVIRALLQAGVNVNAVNSQCDTALIIAARQEPLPDLLSSLIPVGQRQKHAHIYKARNVCFGMLLGHNADVNIADKNEKTALMLASRSKDTGVFQLLLEHGANVNIQDREGKTLLMYAVGKNDSRIAKMLLEHGADANKQDRDGKTALMLASISNDDTISPLLLEHSANANIQDTYGKTALIYAVKSNKRSHCQTLLEHGADANIQSKYGKTALMYATQFADGQCCQMLLRCHALVSAVENGQVENSKLLSLHIIDINLQDESGGTALMYAVRKKNVKLCQVLVDNKCDVNLQDKKGRTALHYAFDNTDSVLHILLQAGANVNKQDKNGRTLLMNVAQSNYVHVIQLLIDYKADTNLQDEEGKTALMHAILMPKHDNMKTTVLSRVRPGTTSVMHAAINFCNERICKLLNTGADSKLNYESNCKALLQVLQCLLLSKDAAEFQYYYKTLKCLLHNGVNPVLKDGHIDRLYSIMQRKYLNIGKNILKPELTRLFVWNGVVNEPCDSPVRQFYKSPLGCALHYHSLKTVKYFLANCYLTLKDISDLRQSFKWQSSSLKLPRHEMSDEEVDLNIITAQAVCQPWPLVKLAFISMSTALGPGPDRQNRVTQTQLPDRLQRMLMFQEPVSRLPVSEWEDIPLTFDPVEYEKLPRPRPLLYYWPVGRDLVV